MPWPGFATCTTGGLVTSPGNVRSTLQGHSWFETEVFAEDRNYHGFLRLNTELAQHEATRPLSQRVNLLRRLALPPAIQSWSLTSLQQRLFKTGGRLIRHARYFILQLAESHLTRRLFGQILRRIERLAWHPT